MIVVHFRKAIFRTVASSIVCSSSFLPILYLPSPHRYFFYKWNYRARTAHMTFLCEKDGISILYVQCTYGTYAKATFRSLEPLKI